MQAHHFERAGLRLGLRLLRGLRLLLFAGEADRAGDLRRRRCRMQVRKELGGFGSGKVRHARNALGAGHEHGALQRCVAAERRRVQQGSLAWCLPGRRACRATAAGAAAAGAASPATAPGAAVADAAPAAALAAPAAAAGTPPVAAPATGAAAGAAARRPAAPAVAAATAAIASAIATATTCGARVGKWVGVWRQSATRPMYGAGLRAILCG